MTREPTPLRTVSNSEVETYRQCRLKHQLSYIERWRTEEEAEALSRGTLFHSVMEAHYKRILEWQVGSTGFVPLSRPDAASLYAAVSPLLHDRETGRQSERQALVEWIYRGYVDLYKTDPDWEIVAVEMQMDEPLPEADGSESEYRLAGTVDLLLKDHKVGGGLWLIDHKTCKNLPKGKDYDMEDQTGIYAYLLSQQGLDIRGAIYNHCRTYKLQSRAMVPEERFKRHRTVRTIDELRTMTLEVLELMKEAYEGHERRGGGTKCKRCWGTGSIESSDSTDDSYWDCSTCEGTGRLPTQLYDAPRTPDGERCGWKCNLTEACLAGRKSGPERTRQFLKDIGFTQHATKPGPTFNKEKT